MMVRHKRSHETPREGEGIDLTVSSRRRLAPGASLAGPGMATVVTLLLAVGEAWWYGSSWFGVLVVAVGTAVLVIGNRQLAAGIAM